MSLEHTGNEGEVEVKSDVDVDVGVSDISSTLRNVQDLSNSIPYTAG
jgi:hypothetical protein